MEAGEIVNSEIKENTAEDGVVESFSRLKGTLGEIERKNDLLFKRGSHWDEVRKNNPQTLISPLNKQGVELSLDPTFDSLEISWLEEGNKRISIAMGVIDVPGEKGPYYSITTQTRDKNYETFRNSSESVFRQGKRGQTGQLQDGTFGYTLEPKGFTQVEWEVSEDKALIDKVSLSLETYATSLPEPAANTGILGKLFRRSR